MTKNGTAKAIQAAFVLLFVASFTYPTAAQTHHHLLSSTNTSSPHAQAIPQQETSTRQFMDPAWRNQFEERDQDLRYFLTHELPHQPYRLDHTVIEFLNSQFWFHMSLPELHVEKISKITDQLGHPIVTFHDDATSQSINQRLHHKVNHIMALAKQGAQHSISIQQGPLYHLTYTVHDYTPNLLSLAFECMIEEGGAHPTWEVSTHNFDLKKGAELHLADLFKPDSPYLERLATLSNIVLPRELMKNNTPDGSDKASPEKKEQLAFYQETFKVLPEKKYFENWNLNGKGLIITFQYGLFCGHACGRPSIIIPYDKLRDLLQPHVIERYIAPHG
jgi:hypothetical protein